jgi:hypothetical protein
MDGTYLTNKFVCRIREVIPGFQQEGLPVTEGYNAQYQQVTVVTPLVTGRG